MCGADLRGRVTWKCQSRVRDLWDSESLFPFQWVTRFLLSRLIPIDSIRAQDFSDTSRTPNPQMPLLTVRAIEAHEPRPSPTSSPRSRSAVTHRTGRLTYAPRSLHRQGLGRRAPVSPAPGVRRRPRPAEARGRLCRSRAYPGPGARRGRLACGGGGATRGRGGRAPAADAGMDRRWRQQFATTLKRSAAPRMGCR